MKKLMMGAFFALALIGAVIQPVAAGGSKSNSNVLRVGATPVPHAELLALVRNDLKSQGYDLEVVEFTDYVTPNAALIAGDIDANFFQHIPYLGANSEWTNKLVSAFGVHIEPFGLYSRKYKSINDIPNNSTIALPNDPTNGGRALLLLQANGLIKLKPNAGLEATDLDIVSNPKNLKFRALEAAQLPRTLSDVDAAAINGNFALESGLNPTKDALAIEGSDSPYVNIVVVRKGDEKDKRVLALKKALLSDKVRTYITGKWTNGSIVPIF